VDATITGDPEAVRDRLLTVITIDRDAQSGSWHLLVEAADRELALSVAGAAAQAFTEIRDAAIHQRRQQAETASIQASEALRAAEEALKLRSNEESGRRAELNVRLELLVAERMRKEQQLQAIKRMRDARGGADDAGAMLPAPLRELTAQETNLARRKAELEVKFLSRHPAVVKVDDDLRRVREAIEKESAEALRATAAELTAVSAQEGSLRRNIAGLGSAAQGASPGLDELERAVETKRIWYRESMAELAQTSIWRDAAHGGSRIVAPPAIVNGSWLGRGAIFTGVAMLSLALGLALGGVLDWVLADARRQRAPAVPGAVPKTNAWPRALSFGIGALLVGVSLIALAIPRFVAAVLALPGDHILAKIEAERAAPDAGRLELLIASRRSALAVVDSATAQTDLGLALLLKASSLSDPVASRHALVEAIAALRSALAVAPARPHAWTRLALAELAASGPSVKVAAALKMAIETGPCERELLVPRLRVALATLSYFPPVGEALIRDQIRLVSKLQPYDLDRLARETPGSEPIIRAALSFKSARPD
jgi:hypothetical protein